MAGVLYQKRNSATDLGVGTTDCAAGCGFFVFRQHALYQGGFEPL